MVTNPRGRIGPTRAESLLDPLNRESQIVVEVVAPHIPLPDDSVPLEAILEFREDPLARETLLRLRSWIRNAALKESGLEQINQDIVELRNELGKALSSRGISRKPYRVTALVVAAAGLLDQLLHKNVRGATEDAVAMFRSTERHLLSDPQMAGSEVGYLLLTERRFAD
jgi:hypothetical protein